VQPDLAYRHRQKHFRADVEVVRQRMTMMGGQSIEFFIGVAAFLGYTVTITE
jgi:uncharacterized protein YmfQ (DUF2313 family)